MRAWPAKIIRGRPAPAAFLDRDGTLNPNRPGTYIVRPEQLKLYAGAGKALRLIAAKGYRLVVLTNQSAVARGYMTLARSKEINLKLVRELKKEGVKLDAVYFCPHGPSDGCACRKPRGGLVSEAVRDLAIDLAGSFVAGDKKSDLDLARAAGIKGRLVLTGEGRAVGAARETYKDLLSLAKALPDLSKEN